MANRLVHWGSAVDFVAELPAVGNAIGDTRLVCYPPGGVRATPYTWDGAAWRPYNDPLTGILRLYVDGTAGNDAAAGTGGWGNAWKTWGRIYRAACAILSVEPDGLTLILYLRGTFAEAIRGSFHLCGSSRVHVVHAIDDFTAQRTGTVTAVDGEAPAPKHGLSRLTLNVAPALDGTELGMTLRLDDPITGSRGTCTILRVDVPNQRVWTTQLIGEYPAWVAASPANAIVCTPSVYTSSYVALDFYENMSYDATATEYFTCNSVIGLRSAQRIAVTGAGIAIAGCYARSTGGTWQPIIVGVRSASGTAVGFKRAVSGGVQAYISDILASEFGIINGPTPPTATCLANGSIGVLPMYGSRINIKGYVDASGVDNSFGADVSISRCSAGYFYNATGSSVIANAISRGSTTSYGGVYCHSGNMKVSTGISFLDLPTTGTPALFASGRNGANIEVGTANLEGDNTGTGAGLKLAHARGGSIVFTSGIPNTLKAKNRQLSSEEGGSIVSRGAVVFDANAGGDCDVYAGAGGSVVEFQDNFTKSAVNSETAIQSGVDGQIIVGAPDTFVAASAVFTSAHVGRSIKVSVAGNAGNIGVHEITSYVSPTTVGINNIVAPVNEAGLTWGLVGTPRPILEVARGGRVSQASGKTFNVRKPEVEPAPGSGLQEWGKWGYGLSGTGFVHIHEGGEVVLGTLVEAAGAANAAGIAARVKNGSKLLHTGGAVVLGTAPLDLGGVAAQAWPATPITDDVASIVTGIITGQGCKVIPNV